MSTHLITGAGSGIGSAIADRLHARGDDLVLVARSAQRAGELTERYPGCSTVIADLADAASLGGVALPDTLDSVVHSAGVVEIGDIDQLGVDLIRWHLEVNLTSPIYLTGLCLPALRRARGTVIFINSTSGKSTSGRWAAYGASKHGLVGYAQALSTEPDIRVTTLYPSRTATPMQADVHVAEGREYRPEAWIEADTVAKAAVDAIDLGPDAVIEEITIRPAR